MSDLEIKAQNASSLIPPAELHGLVCGFSAARPQQFLLSDFVLLAGADALSDETSVAEFVNDSLEVFYSEDLSFVPLVPDDEEPLSTRLSSLAEWCAGFLSGYGAVASEATTRAALPPDVQEILRDFSSISGLDEEAHEAEDENAYMEIYEYVRVAAVLTHTLMFDLYEGASEDS